MYVLNVTSAVNSMYITFEKYNSVFGLVPSSWLQLYLKVYANSSVCLAQCLPQ